MKENTEPQVNTPEAAPADNAAAENPPCRTEEKYGAVQIISNFISTFVVAIVVIVAIMLVALRVTGSYAYNVESASMTPELPVNSLVIVVPCESSEIEVGDIITYVFNESGLMVTHRVVSVDKEDKTFTTKGDANDTADPSPVMWGNVVGKVVFDVPLLGKPLSVITDEDNRTAVIVVIGVLILLTFSWDFIAKRIFGKKKKQKQKKTD